MKKRVVYTLDALNPDIINDIVLSDIANFNIEKIIIPTFILRKAYETYDVQSLKKVINKLQSSSKIVLKDFPILHSSEPNSTFSYFVIFMMQISKEYKNLYVRTRDYNIMIECLKRGFKIFSDKNYNTIFNCINQENAIIPQSNIVFIDTCYYINIFHLYKGLNIIKDSSVKKIIFSCILEELLKINEIEVLDFLIFLITNRKKYNIEFISISNAYSPPYFCNDLMMLSYVMQLKNRKVYNNLTVYTADLEFALQCIGLNIKVAEIIEKPSSLIDKNDIETSDNKKENKTKKIENDDSIKKIPILIKKGISYVSAKEIPVVFKDIASGAYSDMFFEKGVRYFKIKQGWHVKLVNKEKNKVFRIAKIDKELSIAYIEKTSLIL